MTINPKPSESFQLSLIAVLSGDLEIQPGWLQLFGSYSGNPQTAVELVLVCEAKQYKQLQSESADYPFLSLVEATEKLSSYREQILLAVPACRSAIVGLLATTDCSITPNTIPTAVRVIGAFPTATVIVPSYSLAGEYEFQAIDKYNFFQNETLQPAGWEQFQELPQTAAPVVLERKSLQGWLESCGELTGQDQLQIQLRRWVIERGPVYLLPAEAAVAADWKLIPELTAVTTVPLLFGQFGRQVHSSLHKVVNETRETELPAVVPARACEINEQQPVLSLLVIAYDMQSQLPNTLATLNADYQLGVERTDYEVLLIENSSANNLDSETQANLPDNFRYFLREETSKSPAAAINFGLAKAQGSYIGLMIDGAHMLTPGVLQHALIALRLSERAFVTVPTYHLGPDEQNISTQHGYNEAQQQQLLDSIGWQSNGYDLFSISSLCGANPRGYLAPIMESNCYFAARELFAAVGGADESYQQPGGGSLNLDLVRKLGIHPGVEYFCLFGEGSFHQFHGGVTSNQTRADYATGFKEELHERWDQSYHFLERNPFVVGAISSQSRKYLEFSSYRMLKRFDNFKDRLDQVWSDD